MYRVLVTDSTFEDLGIEKAILEPLGCLSSPVHCKCPPNCWSSCFDRDFVITQFAPVNAAVIEAMVRARLIVRYGIGVDNVDLDAARSHGIPVCNVPDYCIDEVADHTLAFILAATRQVVPHCLRLRDGRWGLEGPARGDEDASRELHRGGRRLRPDRPGGDRAAAARSGAASWSIDPGVRHRSVALARQSAPSIRSPGCSPRATWSPCIARPPRRPGR